MGGRILNILSTKEREIQTQSCNNKAGMEDDHINVLFFNNVLNLKVA